jgi:polar amino acid transport system substrate-binding protein
VRVRRLAAAALVAGSLAGAACTQADVPDSLPGSTEPEATTTTAPPPEPDCGDPEASLRPTGPATSTVPAGSYMAEIQARGHLRVGVDTATMQLSSIDPLTGNFVGFDVDIAREVAAALFGERDPAQLAERIAFVGMPSSERIPALERGDVDLVAHAFTPTCGRREQVEFSTDYFTSQQRVLVREDAPVGSVDELADQRICSAAGTTTLTNIEELPDPGPEAVSAPTRADCLVLLQQGQVDGVSTNDTILAGFMAQDPTLKLIDGSLSQEPTALGLPLGHEDWVRYVNAVLEDVRTSGRWNELYVRWLEEQLGDSPGPPSAAYRD